MPAAVKVAVADPDALELAWLVAVMVTGFVGGKL